MYLSWTDASAAAPLPGNVSYPSFGLHVSRSFAVHISAFTYGVRGASGICILTGATASRGLLWKSSIPLRVKCTKYNHILNTNFVSHELGQRSRNRCQVIGCFSVHVARVHGSILTPTHYQRSENDQDLSLGPSISPLDARGPTLVHTLSLPREHDQI